MEIKLPMEPKRQGPAGLSSKLPTTLFQEASDDDEEVNPID